ncbi:MAG: YihY/virulence factor BrkB family protein [Actinobacteria bacterium]|nr:YihY/virulence factor BrkB family protein [Actinomycetota bacterium]
MASKLDAVKKVPQRAKVLLERARAKNRVVDIAMRTLQSFSEDDGGSYAAALTYYTFFSIFPLLLFSASILGFLTDGDP